MATANHEFRERTLKRALTAGHITEAERDEWAARLDKEPVQASMELLRPRSARTAKVAGTGMDRHLFTDPEGKPFKLVPGKATAATHAAFGVKRTSDPTPKKSTAKKAKSKTTKQSKAKPKGTGLLPELDRGRTVQTATAHRDRTINEAIQTGKISRDERRHYEGMWAKDAVGTQLLLTKLQPVKTQASDPKPKGGQTGLLPELGR